MKTIEELQEEIKALKEKNKDLRATNKQQKEEISELKKQLKSPIKNIILGGETIDASSIGPLNKELKTAIKSLHFGQQELRFVVDRYYDIQTKRIELSNQIFAIEKGEDDSPDKCHDLLDWELSVYKILEKGYQQAMEIASTENRSGRWLRSILGVGPALAATLEAYLDIEKAPHQNSFIQYAGLNDNNRPWLGREKSKELVENTIDALDYEIAEKVCTELNLDLSDLEVDGNYSRKKLLSIINKSQKDKVKHLVGTASKITYDQLEAVSIASQWSISYLEPKCGELDEDGNYTGVYDKEKCIAAVSAIPYNKKLKTACWKIGEQILKVSNNPNSLYGRLYKERKAYELEKNENLEYKDQASHILNNINIKNKDVIKINKEGKLTKGHIEARAKRYAVTMLLRHYWEACYYYKYNEKPELPYAIQFLGHGDYIGPEIEYDSIQ